MNSFISGLLIGLLVGVIAAVITAIIVARQKRGAASESTPKKELDPNAVKHQQNIEKLKNFIATQEGKITNDLVEKEMKISDATATRYLNELESLGLIKQIGKEGQSVYYEKL